MCARLDDPEGPPLAAREPAAAQRGDETGAHERRLPAARRADDAEEGGGLERLQEPLHLGVPPEEVVRVLLLEHRESAIGAQVAVSRRPRARADGQAPDRGDELVEGPLVVETLPEVHPGPGPEKRRQASGIELLGEVRQQHEEYAKPRVLGTPVERHANLFLRPGTEL
jgi:hypothetical protein